MLMNLVLLIVLQASAGPALAPAASPGDAERPALLRALPAGSRITEADLAASGDDAAILVGKETRRFLPAGARVGAADLRAPFLVRRNRPVRMEFVKGPLIITAEGRALADGALGETVRVMNLTSKAAIEGVVVKEGVVEVR